MEFIVERLIRYFPSIGLHYFLHTNWINCGKLVSEEEGEIL